MEVRQLPTLQRSNLSATALWKGTPMKLLSILFLSVFLVPMMQGKPAQKIIDLTYSFDSESVSWPTAETFKLETDFEGTTEGGYYYSAYRYAAAEHGGTHLDAPVHFAKGKNSVD